MSPGNRFFDDLFDELNAEEEAERAAAAKARPILRADRRSHHLPAPAVIFVPPSSTLTTVQTVALLKPSFGSEPMPLLPTRVEPTDPAPEPPLVTGHRTAPLALTTAVPPMPPRTPWWRRLWGWVTQVEKRRDLQRRRHALHQHYPEATWRQCQEAAVLAWEVDRHGSHTLSQAFAIATTRLRNQLDTMGQPALPVEKVPAFVTDPYATSVLAYTNPPGVPQPRELPYK